MDRRTAQNRAMARALPDPVMILNAANDNAPRAHGRFIARSIVSAGLAGLVAVVFWMQWP